MPFADYADMDECMEDNSDKDDPGAYCAQIHKDATGEWPSEKGPAGYDDHKMYIRDRLFEMSAKGVTPSESGLSSIGKELRDETKGP